MHYSKIITLQILFFKHSFIFLKYVTLYVRKKELTLPQFPTFIKRKCNAS